MVTTVTGSRRRNFPRSRSSRVAGPAELRALNCGAEPRAVNSGPVNDHCRRMQTPGRAPWAGPGEWSQDQRAPVVDAGSSIRQPTTPRT